MRYESLKKYKKVLIRLKDILTYEEYIYTLFFIKSQEKPAESAFPVILF